MQVHLTQHSALFEDDSFDVYTTPGSTGGTITSLQAADAAVDADGSNGESAGASLAQIGARVGEPHSSQLGMPRTKASTGLRHRSSAAETHEDGAPPGGLGASECKTGAGQPLAEGVEGAEDAATAVQERADAADASAGAAANGTAAQPQPQAQTTTVFTGAAEDQAQPDAPSNTQSTLEFAVKGGETINASQRSAGHTPGVLVPAAHTDAPPPAARMSPPQPGKPRSLQPPRSNSSEQSASGSGSDAKSATQTELEEASMARSEAEGDVESGDFHVPPVDISRRRNLRNYESRRPATDFEVWRQAEEALQKGVSIPELVKREFERTLGPGSVECAPVLPVTVSRRHVSCAFLSAAQRLVHSLGALMSISFMSQARCVIG